MKELPGAAENSIESRINPHSSLLLIATLQNDSVDTASATSVSKETLTLFTADHTP